MKKMPSARVLRRLLDYNPTTGVLTWKARPVWMFKHSPRRSRQMSASTWNTKFANQPALNARHSMGYRAGALLGMQHLAHRVIWKMHYGLDAPSDIDHINHDRSDNRICNLRGVSHRENLQNCVLSASSTSGTTGVSRDRRRGRWEAHIGVAGRKVSLGSFDALEDAKTARKAAERKFGFHPNHGRASSPIGPHQTSPEPSPRPVRFGGTSESDEPPPE